MQSPNVVHVDPLIPFMEALPMMGMRLSKGYGAVRAGQLAIVRNGRRTFVRASEVERYIASLESGTEKRAA